MSFPLRLQSLTSKQCFMVKIPLDLVTDQRVSELNKSSHKEEQQRGLAFFGFGFNFSPSPSHNIPSYDCPLPLLAPMLFHASLWPTLAAPPTPSSVPSSRAPRTQVLAPRPVWVSWLVCWQDNRCVHPECMLLPRVVAVHNGYPMWKRSPLTKKLPPGCSSLELILCKSCFRLFKNKKKII